MRALKLLDTACVNCHSPNCGNRGNCDCFWLLVVLLAAVVLLSQTGCVPSQTRGDQRPFETRPLESCLALVVDQSSSFSGSWDERASPLMLELMDQFFTTSAGGESRVVIAQLSGSDDVVLFEGRPADLRARFAAPESLSAFLSERSDPGSSPVYRAVGRSLEYVASIPGVTEQTRLTTVVLSDLADNERDRDSRRANAKRMVAALQAYQQLGGGLALYCVDPGETSRWREILRLAGFPQGQFVIQSTLVARPQLPRFE